VSNIDTIAPLLDLIPGSNNCPIGGCTQSFTDYTHYIRHLRGDHGAKYLPWTCAICYNGKHPTAPCYLTEKGFMIHWRKNHPGVATAEEIVHPVYGSHFSFLQVQELRAQQYDPDEEGEQYDPDEEEEDVN